MPDTVQLLRQIVADGGSAGRAYRWSELLAAMEEVVSTPPTQEVERFLLAVLRFSGRVPLDPASELPHSMSAEEMLKSLALQALGRWTGTSYLSEMQRLGASARSPLLFGIARKVMQQAVASEPIPPILSERGMTFVANQRARRPVSLRWLGSPLDREELPCATL